MLPEIATSRFEIASAEGADTPKSSAKPSVTPKQC
jgi:hypothetical protein